MITVIGLHDPALLAPALHARITTCDVLAGGRRQLEWFPGAGRERLVIGAEVAAVVERVRDAHARGEQVVVLASGDPLWYGIGTTLRRVLPPEALEFIPAPSAAQLAFAALGEPWHDALLLSAHGRPLDPVIRRIVVERRRVAILTDTENTPSAIAGRLLGAGFPDCPAAVCERLGSAAERVVRAPLSAIVKQSFDALNVLVLLPSASILQTPEMHADVADDPYDRSFGLADDELEHDGLITHLEVRAVAIATLRLQPADVVWDIGAGSGAVSLDAARVAWRGQVYAVERVPERAARMRHNLARWSAARITLCEGEAPEVCKAWPDPDAVFIGGSGGRMEDLIASCAQRLRPGGRMVINLVTLEALGTTLSTLSHVGFCSAVRQVAVSRSRPLLGQTYLAALNPVYIVSAARNEHVPGQV
ncbi:MAG TPA: precorrin-6y C5,15-methyltransferase (decarboxylating) subunit CbiE [Herpetosiphonaceae bacterium]|nr:precorrin-6y C5,15-methyltransferase (decarboxylating) subunit CbiE [Herpetosiphonaceae bacterium]